MQLVSDNETSIHGNYEIFYLIPDGGLVPPVLTQVRAQGPVSSSRESEIAGHAYQMRVYSEWLHSLGTTQSRVGRTEFAFFIKILKRFEVL